MSRDTTKCRHKNTTEGQHFGFTGSVARPPHTDENRAAHGCVTYTERCTDCGRERDVNANQFHYEYSPWRQPTG